MLGFFLLLFFSSPSPIFLFLCVCVCVCVCVVVIICVFGGVFLEIVKDKAFKDIFNLLLLSFYYSPHRKEYQNKGYSYHLSLLEV